MHVPELDRCRAALVQIRSSGSADTEHGGSGLDKNSWQRHESRRKGQIQMRCRGSETLFPKGASPGRGGKTKCQRPAGY